MSRKLYLIIITITASVAATVYCLGSHRGGRAMGAMSNDAYVWQRAWTESVSEAVAGSGTNFSELVPLTAEVSWRNRSPQVLRVALDPAALRRTGHIGLALRIGSYGGPFNAEDSQTHFLAELAASLIAEAVTNQLSITELQIDFDCAESKLDGYAVWVKAIRRKVAPVRVTITALPAWLKHAAFKRLIAAADGYVLQVHSLERPKGIETSFQLCDPPEARRAVEQAARLGRPFRVALPTHGYLIAFDQTGRFVGLSAEGPAEAWPEGVQLREVRADPEALAQLVRSWKRDRPQALTGVMWYRLPIGQERLNWCWPTLSAVMSGAVPRSEVRAEARHPNPALVEIDLINAGTADYALPTEITLRWQEGRLLAADGLEGFDSAEAGARAVQFQSKAALQRLEPGERRAIGWVRLNKETGVQVELSQPKCKL